MRSAWASAFCAGSAPWAKVGAAALPNLTRATSWGVAILGTLGWLATGAGWLAAGAGWLAAGAGWLRAVPGVTTGFSVSAPGVSGSLVIGVSKSGVSSKRVSAPDDSSDDDPLRDSWSVLRTVVSVAMELVGDGDLGSLGFPSLTSGKGSSSVGAWENGGVGRGGRRQSGRLLVSSSFAGLSGAGELPMWLPSG